MATDYEDLNEDQIHQVDQNDTKAYLIKEAHDRWYSEQEGEVLDVVAKAYQRGYQNAVMDLRKQYTL